MKTTILTVGFALFASLGAFAQNDATMPQSKGDKHSCIMAGADTWTTLGLSTEQVAKVKDIQASCEKDHATATADGSAKASVAKHEDELKTVLTPDQYMKWSQWCDEMHASKGTMKDAAPTTPTK